MNYFAKYRNNEGWWVIILKYFIQATATAFFRLHTLNYHNDNKTSKTLVRLGKAITRYPPLLTGTVGATGPLVVVAGDVPPVGRVVLKFKEEPAAVVAATGILLVVLNHISDKASP